MIRLLKLLTVLFVVVCGCGREKPFPIPMVDSLPFTFFVVADTHYGLDQWETNEAANKATIDAMKMLPGSAWPETAGGGVVNAPVGVLVAGDLTDTANYFNWYGYRLLKRHDGFCDDYGFSGENRLPYPIFEAFGNHDLTEGRPHVLNAIRARNARRQGGHVSASGLQSSWDWGGVHFMNLGLYPGETARASGSLAFLREDKARLANPKQPVILFHHYGFDHFSVEDRWWTQPERDACFEEIKDLNVLAIFHGHLHAQKHYQWNGIDVFIAGKAPDGDWLAVQVTTDHLMVTCRTAQGWGPCWKKEWKTE
ncbi:MAG TPA: metallophosphoesterase [Candidatus Hydrogenedentes bacterium]|nr:metallophosphoesterase [Candidatus Hydrogenedentota bacterium]